jgi:hypothetical protein
MSGGRSGARRCPERGLPGVAAADPRSYDLPDFRTLGDGPYPPILLEAFERPGVRGGDEEQRQPAHADHPGLPLQDPGGAPATGTGRGVRLHGQGGGLASALELPAPVLEAGTGAGRAGHRPKVTI